MKSIVMFLLAVFAVVVVIPMNSAEARMCFRCDGKGRIEKYDPDTYMYGERVPGKGTYYETCPSCGGRGYVDD